MSTVLKLISNINNVTNYKLDGRAICRGAAKLSQPKNAQKNVKSTDIQICKCTDIHYTDMQMYNSSSYSLVVEDSCLLPSL